MALVKLGSLVSDIRGSVGGTVFTRNKSGAIVRQRTVPINPNTARQSTIRAIIAQVSASWAPGTTQAQKDAWGVFAANMLQPNKVGEAIQISGFNQFARANQTLLNAGLAAVADAPVIFNLPGEDILYATEIDAGTGKISVVFDDSRDWVDEDGAAMIVQMGIPQSVGRQFFGGPWRHAGVILGDGTTAPTTPDANIDVPFVVADGQKVWTRAKIIRVDGRRSDWFRSDSIVASV